MNEIFKWDLIDLIDLKWDFRTVDVGLVGVIIFFFLKRIVNTHHLLENGPIWSVPHAVREYHSWCLPRIKVNSIPFKTSHAFL